MIKHSLFPSITKQFRLNRSKMSLATSVLGARNKENTPHNVNS